MLYEGHKDNNVSSHTSLTDNNNHDKSLEKARSCININYILVLSVNRKFSRWTHPTSLKGKTALIYL